MKCDWSYTKVKDILSFVVDNRGKTPPTQEYGYPLLEVNAVSATEKFPQYQVVRKYVSQETYDTKFRKGHPQVGDILVPTVGTLGAVSYVDKKNCCIAQNIVALRGNSLICDSNFLYYILSNPTTRKRLLNLDIGGVQPSIKVPHLLELDILLPPLLEQKKIAAILSSLDDKIKLNNNINENLQQQAFALFDKLMFDSDNTECQVSDIAYVNPKRSLSKNQVARYIDMSQLSTTGAFPSGWEMKPYTGGMRFKNGDTLLARITPCLENGKTAFIDFLDQDEVAFGSTEYIVLAPKEGIPAEFLYCLARYPAFVDYAVKNMNGSSGRQRVSAETIGQFVLPKILLSEIKSFEEKALPIFRKMRYNSLENICLAQMRDIMLPKLMSGEININYKYIG